MDPINRFCTALLCSLPFLAIGQNTYNVAVTGAPGGSNPAYTPANITIDLGDIVAWNCTEGSHNIYAMLDSFPNNPEGFNSSPVAEQAPWTYQRTFTVAGVYNYGCNGGLNGGHWAFQQGTITVLDPNSVQEVADWGPVSVFPVPAENELRIEVPQTALQRVELLSADGRLLLDRTLEGQRSLLLDVSTYDPGNYLVRLTDSKGNVLVRTFVKA